MRVHLSENSIVLANMFFFPVVCVKCVLDHDVRNTFTGSDDPKRKASLVPDS